MVKRMSVSVIDILSTKTKKDADIAAINYLLADKNVDKELICDESTGKYSLFFNDRAEDKTYTFLLSNKTSQKTDVYKNTSVEKTNEKIENLDKSIPISKKPKKNIKKLTEEEQKERQRSLEKTENESFEDSIDIAVDSKIIYDSHDKKADKSKITDRSIANENTEKSDNPVNNERVKEAEQMNDFFKIDIPDGLSVKEAENLRSGIKTFAGKDVVYTRHLVSIEDNEEEFDNEIFNIYTYCMSEITENTFDDETEKVDIVTLIVKNNQITQILSGKCRENLVIKVGEYKWTLLASLLKDESGVSFVTTLKLDEDFTDRDRFRSKDSLRTYGVINNGYTHPYVQGYHVLPATKTGDKNTLYAVINGSDNTWGFNNIVELNGQKIGLKSERNKYIVRVK
jgi:hypothetical protein